MINVTDIPLLPKQMEYIHSTAPHTGYIGGFGSGKTFNLALKTLKLAMEYNNALFLVGAKTYPLLRDSTIRTFSDDVWPMYFPDIKWQDLYNKNESILHLPNGTDIIFRCLEKPGSVTNLNLSYFVIDEASYITEEVYNMLCARLRNPIGPRRGDIVGNPPPPLHWIDKQFARAPDDTRYKYINAPTHENYLLPDGFIQDLRYTYGVTDDFISLYARRYLMGEIVAFEGSVWPMLLPDKTYTTIEAVHNLIDTCPHPDAIRFVAGVDFGCANPFACSWHIIVPSDVSRVPPTWVVLDMYMTTQTSFMDHANLIKDKTQLLRGEYGLPDLHAIWADHDAQGILELTQYDLFLERATKHKMRERQRLLIERLLVNGKFFIVRSTQNEKALEQMCQYRYAERKNELNLKEEPVKADDHFVDSLLMAAGEELEGTFLPLMKSSSEQYMYTDEPDPERPATSDVYDEAFGQINSLAGAF